MAIAACSVSRVMIPLKRPARLIWYLQQIRALAEAHLPHHALTTELAAAVARLAALREQAPPDAQSSSPATP